MLEEAQRELSNLVNAILSDDRIRSEFNLFDASVSQKLWSTKYYCNELLRLEVHSPSVSPSLSYTESITATTLVTPLIDYVIKPFENYTYSTESPTSKALPEDILDYYRHLNRLLDGFFMNAMSALDTIAHQISTLYVLEKIYEDKDIYIGLVAEMLRTYHDNSKVRKVVREVVDRDLREGWFKEFSPFRHCTTHESLILLDDIHIIPDPLTRNIQVSEIILPDNPKVRPFTQHNKKEATSYCQSTLNNIQSLVSEIYKSILLDIHIAEYRLPIPPNVLV
ncbi:MAG TPA: hypothetical protein VMW64_06365 [Dehalococcoidia bacterium]|nr:hypothetical protein [Dehalococcoidia bacterium]